MRHLVLFEEYIENVRPARKNIKDIIKSVIVIPNWKTY